MPNRSTDALFQLVKSLEKSEKRNFKLYAKRNSSSEDLKVVQLFDALDKMADYNEKELLKKTKSVKKQQLSNIKANLYKQILSSLRLIRDEANIDIHLHEMMDHARILYNKGLYLQSLKMLERLKETAKAHQQLTFLQQVLFFEKKIESLYITRSIQNKADLLTTESDTVTNQLTLVFLRRTFLQMLQRQLAFMRNCICTRVMYGMHLFARIFYSITVIRKNGWMYLQCTRNY